MRSCVQVSDRDMREATISNLRRLLDKVRAGGLDPDSDTPISIQISRLASPVRASASRGGRSPGGRSSPKQHSSTTSTSSFNLKPRGTVPKAERASRMSEQIAEDQQLDLLTSGRAPAPWMMCADAATTAYYDDTPLLHTLCASLLLLVLLLSLPLLHHTTTTTYYILDTHPYSSSSSSSSS